MIVRHSFHESIELFLMSYRKPLCSKSPQNHSIILIKYWQSGKSSNCRICDDTLWQKIEKANNIQWTITTLQENIHNSMKLVFRKLSIVTIFPWNHSFHFPLCTIYKSKVYIGWKFERRTISEHIITFKRPPIQT